MSKAPDHQHSHEHCHDHDHAHEEGLKLPFGVHVHSPLKNITAAFFLNLVFSMIELVGGFFTGSVSILANAVHDLGDTVSLGSAFYLEKISHQKRDGQYSFGYRRFALLSAVFTGVLLIAGSLIVLKEAIPRFFQPSDVQPSGMLYLAILGIIFNGWAAWGLFKGKSHHEKMIAWHQIQDAAGWVLVLVGSYFIKTKGWFWLDPLMACALALWVLANVVKNLKATFEVLLQRAPRQFDEKQFVEFILKIEGVAGLHDLHVWSMDGERHVLSLHLVLHSDALRKVSQIKAQIQNFVSAIGTFHTTIETEEVGDDCHENCDK